MADSSGEKTEKATPKRKRDERKKGNVFSSSDFSAAMFIIFLFLVMKMFSKSMYQNLGDNMLSMINMVGEYHELSKETLHMLVRKSLTTFLLVTGPIFIVAVVVPVIFTGIQTKFIFSKEALKPKFSRLSPLQGIKKIFALRSIVELVKNLLKLAIIAGIIYTNIKGNLVEIVNLFDVDIKVAVVYLCSAIFSTVMTIAIVFVFLGIADIGYQWWEHEKNMKMTKQEVKEEYKQMEGDPQIKGKIKQKQREISQRRMMEEVPEADVIIRNPTHYAVAIKYDIDEYNAPIVVAKGKDLIALKIIEIAKEHDVVMTENKPLARALYAETDIGQEIPYEFYSEVAEILAFVYDLKNKKLSY